MMSAVVALTGWLCAVSAAMLAMAARRVLLRRTEHVVRAAHELRGPLTALRLGLHGEQLSLARSRAMELELGRAALALDDLTAGLGLGTVGLALERVDARQLLTDSVEAWRPAATRRQAEVRFDWAGSAACVLGDRYRLAQATDNLIANAIEHGGGVIEVRGRRDDRRVRIQVTDGGPGLPASVSDIARRSRPERWPRTSRGDSSARARQRRGRGRGLAIASQIARDHGGRLAAAPSRRGARLILELPVAGAGALSPERGDRTQLS